MMNTLEQAVRQMTKPERRAYLLAAGWTRIGPDTWLHPTSDPPGGDRGFYTLAAAIRTALNAQRKESQMTAHAVKDNEL